MKTKTRGLLALAGMLLIGLALGALVSGTLQARRLSSIGGLVRPDRLPNELVRALGPLDADREQRILARLETVGRAIHERILLQREETRAYADSLFETLRPELDERQWRALKERMGAMERRFDRFPPGGPGGPGFEPGRRGFDGPGRGDGPRGRRPARPDSGRTPPPPPPGPDVQ